MGWLIDNLRHSKFSDKKINFDWEIYEVDETAKFFGDTDFKVDTFIEI